MIECVVDEHTRPTMQCSYVMGEIFMAEKTSKALVGGDKTALENEGLHLWTEYFLSLSNILLCL